MCAFKYTEGSQAVMRDGLHKCNMKLMLAFSSRFFSSSRNWIELKARKKQRNNAISASMVYIHSLYWDFIYFWTITRNYSIFPAGRHQHLRTFYAAFFCEKRIMGPIPSLTAEQSIPFYLPLWCIAHTFPHRHLLLEWTHFPHCWEVLPSAQYWTSIGKQ